MSRFIESLCIRNGEILNARYHGKRLNKTRFELFGATDFLDVVEIIGPLEKIEGSIRKCRILYDCEIREVQIADYAPKKVTSLQMVYHDDIDYRHKSEDRSVLDALLAQRKDADDIIIVKNGLVTDTSYSNIIFFDGDDWLTPAEPLLCGTQRQYLLDTGKIRERPIVPADLASFEEARLINAMLDFDHAPRIAMAAIRKS